MTSTPHVPRALWRAFLVGDCHACFGVIRLWQIHDRDLNIFRLARPSSGSTLCNLLGEFMFA